MANSIKDRFLIDLKKINDSYELIEDENEYVVLNTETGKHVAKVNKSKIATYELVEGANLSDEEKKQIKDFAASDPKLREEITTPLGEFKVERKADFL